MAFFSLPLFRNECKYMERENDALRQQLPVVMVLFVILLRLLGLTIQGMETVACCRTVAAVLFRPKATGQNPLS